MPFLKRYAQKSVGFKLFILPQMYKDDRIQKMHRDVSSEMERAKFPATNLDLQSFC